MGGWAGLSAGLDLLGKRESFWSDGSRTPDRPAPGLSLLPADAWQLADVHEKIQLIWPSVPCTRLSRPLFPPQTHATRGQAQWRTERGGGLGCSNPPPRNSEDISGVLDRLSKKGFF